MSLEEGIAMEGVLTKASTTVDGGWRITFDLPASSAPQVLQLSQLRDCAVKIIVIQSLEDPLDG